MTHLTKPDKISKYLIFKDGKPFFGCVTYMQMMNTIDGLMEKYPEAHLELETYGSDIREDV
jgi:hypothetical protein